MLFCRTTIKRGGDREGEKMEEEEKNRESKWRWGKITRWGDGYISGFCSLFSSPQNSLDQEDPGKARWEFCEKVGVK